MGMLAYLVRVDKETLDSYLADSQLLESMIENNQGLGPNWLDLDKSWDGLLFLLNGEGMANIDHPLTSVLFSDQVIDPDQDLGYGPANYLLPEQVKDLSDQLSLIIPSELKQRYDPQRMNECQVYPTGWDTDHQLSDFLVESFKELQKFYAQSAVEGLAIISFLS